MTRAIRLLLSLAAILTLGAATTGCSSTASEADCEKLLSHMVKLEIQKSGTKGLNPEMAADVAKAEKAIALSLHDDFIKQCTEDTPGDFVSCALKKQSVDKFESCDR